MTAPSPGPDEIRPLAGLIGTWRGTGRGDYPTVEPFEYEEEAIFACSGKPFLSYAQRTWSVPDGSPLHVETGYLRPAAMNAVELVIAQPTGIAEVLAGELSTRDGTTSVRLESTSMCLTPTAKNVTVTHRTFEWTREHLRYRMDMAAVEQDLQFHLEAVLTRQKPPPHDRQR
jgi:hypothetical protein